MISTLQALKTYLWGCNFGPFCSTTIGFRDIRSPENRKCTEWPQTELEHLTVKITPCTLNTYPWGPILVRFALRVFVSEIQYVYKVGENWKGTEWSQIELEHLTVKSTLYTLCTYPRSPNFGTLRSTTNRFHDTSSSKIGNAPNDLKLNLNT